MNRDIRNIQCLYENSSESPPEKQITLKTRKDVLNFYLNYQDRKPDSMGWSESPKSSFIYNDRKYEDHTSTDQVATGEIYFTTEHYTSDPGVDNKADVDLMKNILTFSQPIWRGITPVVNPTGPAASVITDPIKKHLFTVDILVLSTWNLRAKAGRGYPGIGSQNNPDREDYMKSIMIDLNGQSRLDGKWQILESPPVFTTLDSIARALANSLNQGKDLDYFLFNGDIFVNQPGAILDSQPRLVYVGSQPADIHDRQQKFIIGNRYPGDNFGSLPQLEVEYKFKSIQSSSRALGWIADRPKLSHLLPVDSKGLPEKKRIVQLKQQSS